MRVLRRDHQDLEQGWPSWRVPRDLYLTAEVIHILVPPLRERPEEIPILASTSFSAPPCSPARELRLRRDRQRPSTPVPGKSRSGEHVKLMIVWRPPCADPSLAAACDRGQWRSRSTEAGDALVKDISRSPLPRARAILQGSSRTRGTGFARPSSRDLVRGFSTRSRTRARPRAARRTGRGDALRGWRAESAPRGGSALDRCPGRTVAISSESWLSSFPSLRGQPHHGLLILQSTLVMIERQQVPEASSAPPSPASSRSGCNIPEILAAGGSKLIQRSISIPIGDATSSEQAGDRPDRIRLD